MLGPVSLVAASRAITVAVHWPLTGVASLVAEQFLGRVRFSGCGAHA